MRQSEMNIWIKTLSPAAISRLMACKGTRQSAVQVSLLVQHEAACRF